MFLPFIADAISGNIIISFNLLFSTQSYHGNFAKYYMFEASNLIVAGALALFAVSSNAFCLDRQDATCCKKYSSQVAAPQTLKKT